MNADNLPYNMGNTGDLIKHGVIAEFCQYWLDKNQGSAEYKFWFYDPFGGRPFETTPVQAIVNRVDALSDCALKRAQSHIEQCYYGSASIVRNLVQASGHIPVIHVSDRDQAALSDLEAAGFNRFFSPFFDPGNSFTILECPVTHNSDALLLLDPYAEFMQQNPQTVLSKLGNFISHSGICIALFILYDGAMELGAQQLLQHKQSRFDTSCHWLSLTCPALRQSAVRGEGRYTSEILLLLPASFCSDDLQQLKLRIVHYAEILSGVLPVPIAYASSLDFDLQRSEVLTLMQ